MDNLRNTLLCATIALVPLVGCQKASPPSEKTSQEPTKEEPMVEESFEAGDTGALASEPEASTESEEGPKDDSQ